MRKNAEKNAEKNAGPKTSRPLFRGNLRAGASRFPTWAALASAGLLALTAGCAIDPLTGKRSLALIPESQEIEMGKQAAAETEASIGIVDNPALASYIEGIGKKLTANSERPNLPWTFKVADDPVVNAFALPGGPLFVTRGLLVHLTSEAQLASVMGHETGHVTARHSVRQMSKAQIAQLGLAIGMAVSDTFKQLGQLGMGGLQLLFLSYGRDDEREADDLGFRYAVANGWEVREMPGVFATLKRVSAASGGQSIPDWMSTHPSEDERIERIQKRIQETNPPAGKVGHDELVAMTNGLVYGADPRHGFFEGGVFKHPDLKLQLKTPAGWKTQNMSQAVVAQSADGKAGFQMTVAKGATPDAALQEFSTGNQAVSNVKPVDLPLSSPGRAVNFSAKTDDGEVQGLAAFVSHQGKTFQLLGIAPADAFAANEPALRATMQSFAPLTEAAALAVQPARIKVISVPQATTLAALAPSYPSLPAARLALINQLEPTAPLTPGQKLKVVEGKVRE